jgi:hypothetical protein
MLYFKKIITNNTVMKHKKILVQNTAKIKRDLNQTRIKSKYNQPITFCNATTRAKMALANK